MMHNETNLLLPAQRTCARASFKVHGKCDYSIWTHKNKEANSQLMEINIVQTVKEYLNSLPGVVVQTKRHLFSNDLNTLETFSRRLEDSLNIVNTLKTRFEQSQASVELLLHIRQLKNYIDCLVVLKEHY